METGPTRGGSPVFPSLEKGMPAMKTTNAAPAQTSMFDVPGFLKPEHLKKKS